jgi:hypothetical protein
MTTPRKVLYTGLIGREPSALHTTKGFRLNDDAWLRLQDILPGAVARAADTPLTFWRANLRAEIEAAVTSLVKHETQRREYGAAAVAMRSPKPGKGEPAPLERYAKALGDAARAWETMKAAGLQPEIGGDRVGPLAAAAKDMVAELRRLTGPHSLGPGWEQFVREVADAFRHHDFKPTSTGRGYEKGATPSWFQALMLALNKALPPTARRATSSEPAFFKSIDRALR